MTSFTKTGIFSETLIIQSITNVVVSIHTLYVKTNHLDVIFVIILIMNKENNFNTDYKSFCVGRSFILFSAFVNTYYIKNIEYPQQYWMAIRVY